MPGAASSGTSRIAGLPLATEAVFRVLATQTLLTPFVLVGGTAMALQCQHRLSEDLDFWLPQGRLSDADLRPALEAARQLGLDWTYATPPDQISQFRILTGERLEHHARDYAIGGVKVQFFAPRSGDNHSFIPLLAGASNHAGAAAGPNRVETAFRIMPLDGLFAMKSHVITRRHRTRDILDLWHFIRMGRSIADIIQAARNESSAASAEHIISVLRGDQPPDLSDEGFHSLAPTADIERIRADFCDWTDAYERGLARAIKNGSTGD